MSKRTVKAVCFSYFRLVESFMTKRFDTIRALVPRWAFLCISVPTGTVIAFKTFDSVHKAS